MDAPNILSLSAAIGQAVPDALLEEMRLRELDRMRWVDLESRFAQRHFVENLQTHPTARPRTWESAFRICMNLGADLYHAIRQAIIHLRWNRIGLAEEVLARAELQQADHEDEPMSEDDADIEDGDMV